MRLRVLANFAFDPQIFTAQRQADSDPFRRCAQDYDRGIASMPPHVISPCGLRDFITSATRATSLRPCSAHEMLDDSGIIHMNGRLYDAELGRMLSADPFVQVPEYSQNFNRYSYVLNNPLNKTDPTGYSWLSKAFHKIGAWVKENWRTIVSVLVAAALFVFLGPGAFGLPHLGLTGAKLGAAVGAASGAFNAAINGGNLGNVLRGALIGGIQGGITGGLLGGMEPSQFGLTWDTVEHVVGHGVVGGTANEAMGGKFQDGFVSSAVSAFAGDMGWNEGGTLLSRTIKAGIIGGTASALGGGKFANGAWTASFQHLLNRELHTGDHWKQTIDGKKYDVFVGELELLHEDSWSWKAKQFGKGLLVGAGKALVIGVAFSFIAATGGTGAFLVGAIIAAGVVSSAVQWHQSGYAIDPYTAGEVFGGVLAGGYSARGFATGKEFSFGFKNFRLAPWGNRGNLAPAHPTGRFPHYHRSVPHPKAKMAAKGHSADGQGMSRHRPWDTKHEDTKFKDRF